MSDAQAIRHGLPFPTTDLWGGLAAMLVALPSSIAFGVLIFSAIDPARAGEGALFGMLGAASLGLVAPFIGRTPALITAPCAPSAAVLSGLAVTLVAAPVEPERITALLALTALLSALLQIMYGLLKGGRFIKYIPYPVVSGYLSGVGLIIAIGQLPKLLGLPAGTGLLHGLTEPGTWRWPGVVVGIVTIAGMVYAPRITKRVPAAIIGLLSGMVMYFILAVFNQNLLSTENNPLIIGAIKTSGSFIQSVIGQIRGLFSIGASDLALVWQAALALSALLSIDTLKTCVVLDALTRGRHNSNRELMGQGIANLAAFTAGGMAGAGTMGPTLVNVTSGGTTRWSGTAEGVFVILAILVLSPLIAWVPIGALAGILLVIAFRMFEWSAFKLLKFRETRLDFAVIAAVVVVAETVGLIAASGTGIALAILLFIRDQIRGSVMRKKASLKEVASKTTRLEEERALLSDNGHQALVAELQGNLFFGTTDQMYTELEAELKQIKWLLLDMRRVQSMDYTAANLFRQIHRRLADNGGGLLFCGMPSSLPQRQDINRYLVQMGLVGKEGRILVFETRDEGLEWMENRILEANGWIAGSESHALDLSEVELLEDLDEKTIKKLRECMHELDVDAGKKVFQRGDEGDDIYLIRKGIVRVLLPLSGGKKHHIATFHRGNFFGEMGFLDRDVRSADAEAKTDCKLYKLSRKEFDEYVDSNPAVGARVFSRLARAVSLRLRQTNSELRALEER
jgi:SulP family sulfate permease